VSNEDVDKALVMEEFSEFYDSLGSTMLTLLSAVTGGNDWMNVREPLVHLGHMYTGAFVVFVLFVSLGVMNILTGVFVRNAASINDRDISVHKETEKLEGFVHEMLSLFNEFELDGAERIDWKSFKGYLNHPKVQAYLASLELESTHGLLLFDLLDRDRSGSIDAYEFVIGMLRLRGNAKALDARLLERELDFTKQSVTHLEQSMECLDNWPSQPVDAPLDDRSAGTASREVEGLVTTSSTKPNQPVGVFPDEPSAEIARGVEEPRTTSSPQQIDGTEVRFQL